jgi:putative oxidoreductase
MKTAVLIARLLLGFIFTVFGLNGFLHFLKMPPPAGQLAQQYTGALFVSHYLHVVFLIQLIGGILLLIGLYVPLALVLLGPVLVNVLLFHSTMDQGGLPLAFLTTALWFIVFYGFRHSFAGIFEAKPAVH